MLTCEAELPASASYTSASVLGRQLPRPVAAPQRIVVLGDTGCRLPTSPTAIRPATTGAYPFARIAAAAAAWKPDLVIHVATTTTVKTPARPATPVAPAALGLWLGCLAGRFLRARRNLLEAAPWIMARGNHENCARAGQGYWRWLTRALAATA
jgi:hypothetical protein